MFVSLILDIAQSTKSDQDWFEDFSTYAGGGMSKESVPIGGGEGIDDEPESLRIRVGSDAKSVALIEEDD